MDILVDVIIIAHNEEKNISKCIDCILANPQLNTLIVVDDGSTDKTEEVVQNHLGKDKIMYIKNEQVMGRGYSRWIGIQNAKTHFIGMVDADTFVSNAWLSIMTNGMEDGDILFGLVRFKNESNKPLSKYITAVMNQTNADSNSSTGVLFRKTLHDELPIDKNLKDGEDIDWIARIFKAKKFKVGTIDYVIGEHVFDWDIVKLLNRYYEYGQNRARHHLEHKGLININPFDEELSDYAVCRLIEKLKDNIIILGFKERLMEVKNNEQGIIHSSEHVSSEAVKE